MKNFASKGKSLFCLGFLVMSMLGTVAAQTFTGPGFSIINGSGTDFNNCSSVNVAGITTNVTVANVGYTNLNHPFIGDTFLVVYPPDVNADGFILAGPPDARSCNYAGNYIFSDSGLTTIDAATTGCTTAQNVNPGTYQTSDYGGGTANGPVTSLTGFFGTLTPAQANGEWIVCVFDYATANGTGTVGGTSITFAGPTAAAISISGRVLSPTGEPIRNITLTLTDSSGHIQTARTSVYGNYLFENLPAGTVYTITASGRKFRFDQPTQFVNGTEDFTGADFVGYYVGPF